MAVSSMRASCSVESPDSGFPAFLPRLESPDYYLRPSLSEIASRESADRGYCGRVPDFVVGRFGFGEVKFFGVTDVRRLDLDKIVRFDRHLIVVYEDECNKPPIGHGLNKSAEVTLIIDPEEAEAETEDLVCKLKVASEKQGARFISFDRSSREWKFFVSHFSRFGLLDDDGEDDEEEEEDVFMDEKMENVGESINLSHSLPAHLGLDPVKMQEMRMVMFSGEEEGIDDGWYQGSPNSLPRISGHRERILSQGSSQKASSRVTPIKRAPIQLLEFDKSSSKPLVSGSILLNQPVKGFPVKRSKIGGFCLDTKKETPLNNSYSSIIVDASLLMGRSFRVGWGPNGTLIHSGSPVCKPGSGLSSIIHLEKVALDSAARDEKGKLKDDLIDLSFISPLKYHMSLDHEWPRPRIRKVVADRLALEDISRGFIEILERRLEAPCLSTSSRTVSMHQVTVWELIRVLFSEKTVSPEDDDMALDKKDATFEVDQAASHLIRRANFSFWLQESTRHLLEEEINSLSESRHLTRMLLLLTGRQLDSATELAASSGDVRLAILLAQAGGSMVNRSDMARQLDLWKINGFDFRFLEKERLKLYELLSGNVQAAYQDLKIDWKRYLGLIMWYNLPPDTPLAFIVRTYEQLVNEGKAPLPVPIYTEEGLSALEEQENWNVGDCFDITYYLMLLHAAEGGQYRDIKTMFSAFSSSHDPLDYHMIWHYKTILEAIGTFKSVDLNLLDLSFASQLLSLGLCHWAIYVVLHVPYNEHFPHLHENFIKEILFRYCETWSTKPIQKQFIVDLGVPSSWMDEALAVYYEYHHDMPAALDHFLGCHNWQKSHTIFVISVAHSLFLSENHGEIWRLVGVMETHKAEIPDWDLGGGIYIDFYTIKSLLQERTIDEQETLGEKERACRRFFDLLKKSLEVWGSRIPVDARAVYSRMAEELCQLLVSIPAEDSSSSVQMSCFKTMLGAPMPEDLRSQHLQDALSVFTLILSEMAA